MSVCETEPHFTLALSGVCLRPQGELDTQDELETQDELAIQDELMLHCLHFADETAEIG